MLIKPTLSNLLKNKKGISLDNVKEILNSNYNPDYYEEIQKILTTKKFKTTHNGNYNIKEIKIQKNEEDIITKSYITTKLIIYNNLENNSNIRQSQVIKQTISE